MGINYNQARGNKGTFEYCAGSESAARYLREKTMAALRHGVRTVIIPKDNERDLEEIDQTVRRQLNFISAQTMDTVLSAALNRPAEASPTILTELPGDVRTRVQKPGLRQ